MFFFIEYEWVWCPPPLAALGPVFYTPLSCRRIVCHRIVRLQKYEYAGAMLEYCYMGFAPKYSLFFWESDWEAAQLFLDRAKACHLLQTGRGLTSCTQWAANIGTNFKRLFEGQGFHSVDERGGLGAASAQPLFREHVDIGS